ncbi:MAG: tRNA (adenosine(37)-N6)-threonylcarbamoyltransferase complex dimerization subunit type 1 TsaB [Gemmatimonadota bacterium]|nr:tRNA (adenosine(37)-N6)-threonylcarbamoyltransferase complex dimerization subunit type 1 TsaB [Gemmatimonadota bacterium]
MSAGAPLLAFDTSGAHGSVAVGGAGPRRSGEVLAVAALPERKEHAARLLPTIDAVLREAGVSVGALGGIVVGEGPGSFTGVRVAAATAKGLSFSAGIPLRPISSLAAVALTLGWSGPDVRYVLFDARGDRVYGACYRVDEEALEELVAPHPGQLGDVLGASVPEGAVFLGTGAAKHRVALGEAGFEVAPDDEQDERVTPAVGLLRCAGLGGASPVDDPTAWEPRYVRASSAERLWSA